MIGHLARQFQRRLWTHATSSLSILGVLAVSAAANIVAVSSALALLAAPEGISKPHEVVEIWEVRDHQSGEQPTAGVSPTSYCAVRDNANAFATLANYTIYSRGSYLQVGEHAFLLQGAGVSPGFFSTLAVQPVIGTTRNYTLSYPLWVSAFGQSRSVLGAKVLIEGGGGGIAPGTVSGVLPAQFHLPEGTQVWSTVRETSPPSNPERRRGRTLRVLARLRPGASVKQAQAELTLISGRLATAYPDSHAGWTLRLARVGEAGRSQQRSSVLMVWLASVLLLCLAWTHAAQLLRVGQLASQRDVAVQLALGATRRHVLWNVGAESVLLTTVGTSIGLAIAALLFPSIRQSLAAFTTRAEEVRVSWPVVWAAGVATVVGAALLTWSGFRAVYQRYPADALRENSRTAAPGSPTAQQRLFACAGVAISIALVLCAFGTIRTFTAVTLGLRPIDTGGLWFVPVRFPILKIGEDPRSYPIDRFRSQGLQLVRLLGAARGVKSVSGIVGAPGGPSMGATEYELVDAQQGAGSYSAVRQVVAEHFLETAGIPLLAGENLDYARDVDLPAVVDSIFAHRHWTTPETAIGRRFSVGARVFTIVGVVDVLRVGPAVAANLPVFYVRFADAPADGMTVMLRTESLSLREVAGSMDSLTPDFAHGNVFSAARVWLPYQAPVRLAALAMVMFAGVSSTIAMVGMYAATSSSLRMRRREIGIRMALGASPDSEARRALRATLWPLCAGGAAGFLVYRMIAAVLRQFFDQLLFAGVWGWLAAGLILTVAAGLSALPIRKATNESPALILRSQ